MSCHGDETGDEGPSFTLEAEWDILDEPEVQEYLQAMTTALLAATKG
jgi:hypothetical protein